MTRPQDDFYNAINEDWLGKNKIPQDLAHYSVSTEISLEVEKQLFSLLQIIARDHKKTPLAKLIHSAQNAFQRPLQTEFKAAEIISMATLVQNKEDVCYVMGCYNRYKMRSPIQIDAVVNPFDTSVIMLEILEYKQGMVHPDQYINDQFADAQRKYKEFLKDLGVFLGIQELQHLFEIEKDLATYLPTPVELDDTHGRHNRFTLVELRSQFSEINWDELFRGYGLPLTEAADHQFSVANIKYLRRVNNLFRQYDANIMRIWMQGCAILSVGRYMPGHIYNLFFNFYGKEIRGANSKSRIERLVLSVVTGNLSQMLSRLYVENYVNPETKRVMTEMAGHLRTAIQCKIEMLDWMTPKTKEKAVLKVKKMEFKIAYPEKYRDETAGIELQETGLLQNILILNEMDTRDAVATLGRTNNVEKPSDTWGGGGVYDVNAYYSADYNEMFVPSGILQSPFFDLKKSMAWNFGGIGNVIGHEMTHGFDMEGKSHNENGVYAPWWTEKEEAEYMRRARKLIHFYQDRKYMGHSMDGELTLTENIADLGGMAVALHGLKLYLEEKQVPKKDWKKQYREFFTSYAVSWRTHDRPEKAAQMVLTDRHSPALYRVNNIVVQFQEFYDTYDVKEGDAMYLAPEDRVVLW